MSESRPEYVRCAAGNNLHTDCLVRRLGDLVQVFGHPEMLFTAQDAIRLAVQLNKLATEIQHEATPRP